MVPSSRAWSAWPHPLTCACHLTLSAWIWILHCTARAHAATTGMDGKASACAVRAAIVRVAYQMLRQSLRHKAQSWSPNRLSQVSTAFTRGWPQVLGHSLNQEVVPFRGGTAYAARSCAEPSAVAKRSMLPRRLHNSKTLDDIMWTLNPKLFKEPLRNLNPPASVFELTVDLQLFRALLARPKPSFCRIRINFPL